MVHSLSCTVVSFLMLKLLGLCLSVSNNFEGLRSIDHIVRFLTCMPRGNRCGLEFNFRHTVPGPAQTLADEGAARRRFISLVDALVKDLLYRGERMAWIPSIRARLRIWPTLGGF